MRNTATVFSTLILLLVILAVIFSIHAGLQTDNEDPTNIELEVLRASLLEKEMIIDELRESLDDKNKENHTLEMTVEEMTTEVEKLNKQYKLLLEGQDQILSILDSKEHYFEYDFNELYLLTYHNNEEMDYYYEELIRFMEKEKGQVVYRGKDIQFDLDKESNDLVVLDEDEFQLFNHDLESIFQYTIDLNDPLVDLTPELLLDDGRYNESFILLSKKIGEDVKKLFSVIYIDYKDETKITVQPYYLDTDTYYILKDYNELLYVEETEVGVNLIAIDFTDGSKRTIAVNKTGRFAMYQNNGSVYYYSEEQSEYIKYKKD